MPSRRDRGLLRALFCYELTLEYLDNANERAAAVGVRNGQQLHLALVDALNYAQPITEHYRHHPWCNDAGLLDALVMTCRRTCAGLVSYPTIMALAIGEAVRAQVLALNHDPWPARRDLRLRVWAAENSDLLQPSESTWFERAAAVTGSLTVHALIALAADPRATSYEADRTIAVYRPLSLLATMLDSYVDHAHDCEEQGHSYIDHYDHWETFAEKAADWLRHSTQATSGLRKSGKHAVIAASMIALYLSSQAVQAPGQRRIVMMLLDAAGPLTRTLRPALRLWRIAYGLVDA